MSNDLYPQLYVDNTTPNVHAGWLNDVAAAVWGAIGTGRSGTPPTLPSDVRTNLGLATPGSPVQVGVDSGALNALQLTLAATVPALAYAEGQIYLVEVANTNTT